MPRVCRYAELDPFFAEVMCTKKGKPRHKCDCVNCPHNPNK